MAIISRPTIPEIIYERIKTDVLEFPFNFFQDGVALDVSSRSYKLRFRGSGIQLLEKTPATNLSGRVTFLLTTEDKAILSGSEFAVSLAEVIAGGERTLLIGTLIFSVAPGKTTGLVVPPDVSVNYIEASDELMIALGVQDFGSASSAASAAAAQQYVELAQQISDDILEKSEQIAQQAGQVQTSASNAINAASTSTVQAGIATQKADEVQAALTTAMSGVKSAGRYNAATNTGVLVDPVTGAETTFTPTTTPNIPDGSFLNVVEPGVQNITGNPVAFGVQSQLFSRGHKWDYIPFAVGDQTITKEKLNKGLQAAIPESTEVFNEEYPLVKTPGGRMLLWHYITGVIGGKFDLSRSDIPFAKLPDEVKNGLITTVDAENRDKFPIIRTPAGRMLLWHYVTGMIGGKFDLSLSDIPYAKLPDQVKNGLLTSVDVEFSEFIPILTSANGRMFMYAKKDGTVYIPKVSLPAKSVLEGNLADALAAKLLSTSFKRLNDTNQYDVETDDDLLWRGIEFEIPVKTAANAGFAFQQFPSVKTNILKGLNDTGTDLVFRQTLSLPIRGRYYRGDFDPTASGNIGTNLRGNYGNSATNSYPALPAGATGDCWVIDNGNTSATRNANNLTFKNGDYLVKTASGYAIQPGPGDGTRTDKPGDFWNITAAGWFGGKYYPANSRILHLGIESAAGPKYTKYCASKPGELYHMGECTTGFAPVSARDGDLYIFSAAGTAQGITGITGDMLVYQGGWGLVSGQSVTVANGKSFFLPCQNANEWAVRRVDKVPTEVVVKAKGHRTTVRRKTTDELILFSDSMFGATGPKILAQSGRSGNVHAYGGGTSNDVLAMIRDWARSTDPYLARVHIMWHGQNNYTDTAQIKNVAHQMVEMLGYSQKRFCFWSVLGVRSVSWNGTRLVANVQEDAFNNIGSIKEVESFYDSAYTLQYFSPRKAMLEAAALRTSVPDVQFPGMSEAQSAATYGVLPFSFWFDFTGKPFTQSNLVFGGYHNAAGLPTGGADKDYYIRTGNGTIGQIIVNNAGTWTEYVHDTIHVSPLGQDILAAKFTEYLTLHNI